MTRLNQYCVANAPLRRSRISRTMCISIPVRSVVRNSIIAPTVAHLTTPKKSLQSALQMFGSPEWQERYYVVNVPWSSIEHLVLTD